MTSKRTIVPTGTPSNPLEELSYHFAINRFISSFDFWDLDSASLRKEIGEVFNKDNDENWGFDKLFEENSPESIRSFVSQNKTRNILVVGAGASKAAYNISTADEALKYINDEIGISGVLSYYKSIKNRKPEDERGRGRVSTLLKSFSEKYQEDKESLELLYPNITSPGARGTLDFELTLSLIASHFGVKAVRSKIKEIYDHRYYPCMAYEVIAHLLRHRFIDAVINFNFDELLDQAIDEEIRDNKYKFVLSDGDCEEISELIIKDGMNVPLYIKPHGTVSHPSTMRFTKDDYLGISQDMQVFLQNLISGQILADDDKSNDKAIPITQVNIIPIGFDMTSIEFNQIIQKAIEKARNDDGRNTRFKFYLFEYDETKSRSSLDRLSGRIRQDIESKFMDSKGESTLEKGAIDYAPIQVGKEEKNSLEFHFKGLFKMISNRFSKLHQPRGIWRNEIICAIFHRIIESSDGHQKIRNHFGSYSRPTPGRKPNSADTEYFELRSKIEILISLAVDKGFVNMYKLANGQAGLYHSLFHKYGGDGRSLIDFIYELGLRKSKVYSREIFVENEIERQIKGKVGGDKDLKDRIEKSSQILLNKLFHYKLCDEKGIDLKSRKVITSCFEELLRRNNYSISPEYGSRRFSLIQNFQKDNILNTRLSMRARLNAILKSESWDRLFIVGTRGNLLFSSLYDDYNLLIEGNLDNVFLILTDNTFHEKLVKPSNSQGIAPGNIRYIPYYGRDLFMAFTLNETPRNPNSSSHMFKSGWKVSEAIYFPVDRDTRSITPLYLKSDDDHLNSKHNRYEFLPWTFFEYWYKSSKKRSNKLTEKKFRHYSFVSHKELQRAYEKWLDEL